MSLIGSPPDPSVQPEDKMPINMRTTEAVMLTAAFKTRRSTCHFSYEINMDRDCFRSASAARFISRPPLSLPREDRRQSERIRARAILHPAGEAVKMDGPLLRSDSR